MKNSIAFVFVTFAALAAGLYFWWTNRVVAAPVNNSAALPSNFNTLTPAQQTTYLNELSAAGDVDSSLYQ